jgi:hypothetical protein
VVAVRWLCETLGAVASERASDEPHCGQKPIHLGERYPHESQWNVEELAI